MKITYLVKYGRFMFCLHMYTERTEAQCPRCHVAYGSNEDAACRTPCCGHLLCKSCSSTECWYCDAKSDDADTLSTPFHDEVVVGPDYAVAIHLRYEPTFPSVATYYYCETCALLLFTSTAKMLHNKSNGHVTIRIGGDAAASALKGQFPEDAEHLRESIQNLQKTLARLRANIDASPEYELAAQEAVVACVGMTCDEKDRLLAECQYVRSCHVSTAHEQEQRLAGSIRETQLVLDMIAAARDSSDATWIVSVALSVAATKRVVEVRTYPATTCSIESVPGNDMVSVGRIISSDVDQSATTLLDVSDTSKNGLTYVCDNDSSFCSGTGHATLLCCRSDGSPADVYEEDVSFTSDVMESIEETETSTEDISMGGAGSGSSSSTDVTFVPKQAEVVIKVSKVSTGVFKAEYRLRGYHDEKSPKTYVVNLYARVLGVLVVNRPIRFSVDRCRITKKVCV